VSPAPQSPVALPARLPGLEVGRVAAAVAIVWLHTAGIGPAVAAAGVAGRFAVPFFTLLAAALVADRCTRGTVPGLGQFLRDRVTRLYVPFLFWTVVYLGLRLAKHAWRPDRPGPPLGPHLLVVGSAHHLWYLPFLLAVSLGVRLVAPVFARQRQLAAGVCLVLGCAAAITPVSLPHRPYDPAFWNQANYLLGLAWAAVPSAMWGLGAGLCFHSLAAAAVGRPLTAVVAGALTVALLAPGDDFPGRILRENLSGLAAFVACLALPVGRAARTVAAWGQYTFGVYAVHVAFILAIETVLVSDRSQFSLGQALTIFGCAVAGSFAAAAALARCRWTAWTVS